MINRALILLGFLTIINPLPLNGQSVYYDAIELKELVDTKIGNQVRLLNTNETYKILSKYFPEVEESDPDRFRHLLNASADSDPNPFLEVGGLAQNLQKFKKGRAADLLPLSSINITTVADGLAKFLVERSKEEIAITFFRHFENFFDNNPEAEILFPQTYTFLFEFNSYEYAGMLNALKAAFKNDLNNLPAAIPGLKDVKRRKGEDIVTPYSKFFESNEGKMLTAALELIEPIRNGANAAEVISLLADNPNLESLSESNSEIKNLTALVKTADLLSQSFRSGNSGETWVGYYEIRNLIQDDTTFRIYLGLLYQKSKDIHFYTSANSNLGLQDILAPYASNLDDIRGFYKRSNRALQELSRTGKQLKAVVENGGNISAADLGHYLNSLLMIYEEVIMIDSKVAEHVSEYKNFLAYAKLSLRLYKDLQQKQYTAAFFNAIALIDTTGIIETSGEIFDIRKMRKYGLFMSTVAEAQDADEVAKAIEAAVLPAGSSRIKRQVKWNISINSYLGGFGGVEVLREDINNNRVGTFGVFAPVGLAISKGLGYGGNNKKSVNSISAFFSIIDIGAFASFRIQNDVEELPEFQLQNIIAPGGYLAWNIGGTPLTVLAGAQLGPQLRKIEVGGSTIESSAWRYQAAITVDIPLFNLSTKPWN